MDSVLLKELAERLFSTVQRAGKAEMDVFQGEITVEVKEDLSPVTVADKRAEEIILSDLSEFTPDIPIISEEAASDGHIPEINDVFFLVDPLDGTKEFIKKGSDFTVNIALIENRVPVFGIVYAPALQECYVTLDQQQAVAFKLKPDEDLSDLSTLEKIPLKVSKPTSEGLSVVASKSHMTPATKSYLDRYTVKDFKSIGSSLKFCLLAKGEADIYPRFGPTMEWDTAAGHAILRAAGGQVLTQEHVPLLYKKLEAGYKNPPFIAFGDMGNST